MTQMHHYSFRFTYTSNSAVAVDKALWSLAQTAPATSLPIKLWEFGLSLSVGLAVTPGNLAVCLQREATNIWSGGSAGVIAKAVGAAPNSGSTIADGGGAALTGTRTTTGRLRSFGITTNPAGVTQSWVIHGPRYTAESYSPICVVGGTEQLALVADLAIPATTQWLITGYIHWSEGY
jgi:hypothetical protein